MSESRSQHYIGEELDLFAEAFTWKNYLSDKISPHLGSEVMEVGAGIGTNTMVLCNKKQKRWLCVEPDSQLIVRLTERIHRSNDFSTVEVRLGTIQDIRNDEYFDTILYIDVLEHIQDDFAELTRASKYLRKNGKLLVVAPAHQWLHSPFDKAVGHLRRYTKKTLMAAAPIGLRLDQLYYLDSAGLMASIGNLLLLRKSVPSPRQIQFWNSWLIPISIKLDSFFCYRVGKTIIGVWGKY